MPDRRRGSGALADHARAAYDAFAPHYDAFTAHHDYDTWTTTLEGLARECGLRGRRLLDVACGTGKSFLPLLDQGWKVTACDISPSMAELARAKVGAEVRIEIADMRELPVYGSFDLVCCLDDAVNYLHSQAELEQALRRMAANMAPHALLIFDSNTLTTYRDFFGEHVELEANGRRMIWDGRSGGEVEPGEISEALFEVEPIEPGTGPSIPPELHRQRHHPESEVRSALDAAGLELAGIYGHDHDGIPRQPMSEDEHTKAIYVARLQRTT
jgi:SAM-dependent methyltransferase